MRRRGKHKGNLKLRPEEQEGRRQEQAKIAARERMTRWWYIQFCSHDKDVDGHWNPWGRWQTHRHSWMEGSGPELFDKRSGAVHHAREYCHRNSTVDEWYWRAGQRVCLWHSQVGYRIRSVVLEKEW